MLFYLAKIHNLLCFCFAFVVFLYRFRQLDEHVRAHFNGFSATFARCGCCARCQRAHVVCQSACTHLAQRLSTTATLFVVFWRLFLSFKAPSPAFSRTRCRGRCLLHLPKNKFVFGEFHYLIHARSRCGRLRTAHGMV